MAVDKRIEEILHIISDHLNKKKLVHVDDIISIRYDFFHLPGDKLGKRNVTHKIPTADDTGLYEAISVSAYPQGRDK